MARRNNARSKTPPKYRHHKRSGQAIVTIQGKDHYLGAHGSEESHQKYNRLLTDLWTKPDAVAKPTIPKPDQTVTVAFLAVEFGKFAKKKYRKSNGEQKNEWFIIQNILAEIRATYGDLPASEFGPLRFENYRQSLVAKGLARHTVKRYANHVKKMFQRGVQMELIPVELFQRLEAVGPVEMTYRPEKKVPPVATEIVRATQMDLTPLVSAMVEVQLLTGMRPGEVCNLRPCDINRDDEIWIYEPPQHKTDHHGKDRPIVIGPKAQLILNRYLLRDHQAFCFTPAEAYDQHYDQRREDRETPVSCGNGPNPRKQKTFRPKYDHNSYRRAVQRAAMRAFPVPKDATDAEVEKWEATYKWKPNQLRHNAATSARKEFDLETAQILLGHSSKSTTEKFYAEIDQSRAVEFARKFG